MSIKKIIFLSSQSLDPRNYKRYGLELLQKNGFAVEYWDVTSVLYPHVAGEYALKDAVNFDGLRVFDKGRELYQSLSKLGKESFVMDNLLFNLHFFKLYRALTKSGAEYASIIAGAVPDVQDLDKLNTVHSGIVRKIKKLLSTSPGKIWNDMIIPRLPFKLFGIKSAKLILASGEMSLKYKLPMDSKTDIVWAHALDYDLYLEEKDDKTIEKPIAVFLDSYLPFHPDWLYFNDGQDIDADRYYGALNNFFDIVENNLKIEVVIAAHPRSDYDPLKDYYKGRKCIKGQTVKLVKESKLVLANFSTAINMASLFHKPIIFMTSDDLDQLGFNSVIEIFARFHGKKSISIDKNIDIDWDRELAVDSECYKRYRQAYIKVIDSPDLPFWQIAANRIKNL